MGRPIKAGGSKQDVIIGAQLLGPFKIGILFRLQKLEERYRTELEKEHHAIREKDRMIQVEQEKSESLRKKINELQEQVSYCSL